MVVSRCLVYGRNGHFVRSSCGRLWVPWVSYHRDSLKRGTLIAMDHTDQIASSVEKNSQVKDVFNNCCSVYVWCVCVCVWCVWCVGGWVCDVCMCVCVCVVSLCDVGVMCGVWMCVLCVLCGWCVGGWCV